MTPRVSKTHWLRGNAREDTPRQIIVLDAESSQTTEDARELHQLRCWVARVIVRDAPLSRIVTCSQYEGTEPAEVSDLVERTVKTEGSWRLFTHNLSYDLGLTRLPLDLLHRGWSLGRHNLASDAPWAYLKKGGRGLWLCDSFSWLPTSVEKLGEALGMAKPALPHPNDELEAWFHRCRVDVEISATALLELMTEWDRRNLGWWSVTGPASGWNTMLHFPRRGQKVKTATAAPTARNPQGRGKGERVLIMPDSTARAFERAALYSGRRDVWRVGQLKGGPFAEVDLKQAHLSICANLPLPYRRHERAFDHLELGDWRLEHREAGVVAECLVRCSTPRYPVRLGGIVCHPVGQFKTTLAGPEIREAQARGELESIGKGYSYHLGYVMRDWAQWALGVINSDGETSPMLQIAARSWGRTVPGRWGMTHSKPVQSGASHVQGWELEPITMGNPPRRGYIFHCAGTWTESISDEEADDSFPAVLAYIQSYCRLALNRMLDAFPGGLVSCNTEGAWVSMPEGLARIGWDDVEALEDPSDPNHLFGVALRHLSKQTAPLEVRIKQEAKRLKVLSPQHHQTDQARLYAGIPRGAEELRPDQFAFWTWPKLKGQIERGDPRGYVRERRTVNLAGIPNSRWCFQDGSTEPVEVTWAPETGNVIQKPDPELERRHGPLRASQHPVLRRALQ